ncbi:peptidoglycan-binding protein [Kitasatospora sp. NPDC051853]|uniref:peptidoglycan-binding protein n=1 Tax=Kitasatospora sp. NPDC051853 TaxID=3364058 RepID=UPI0037B01831
MTRRNDRPGPDAGELPEGAPRPERTPRPGRSRTARRQRAVLVVAVASALLSTGGLAATALVRSPAERAAGAAPPPRTLLTAPVVSRVLSPSVTARASVYPPTRYDVVPSAASTEITQLFLSGLHVRTGEAVTAGRLLAEVSGQPLYVLRGPVPAYRDLKPGSTGPDVAELQDALRELGHSSGEDERGGFGPGTKQAVASFYRALGHPVPLTGAATQQAVDAAQKAVDAGRRTVEALTARKNSGRPAAPPSTAPPSAFPSAPAAEQPDGAPDLDEQLRAAGRQLTADRAALARAVAVNGPMVPAAHVVFLPALPAAVTAVNSSVGLPVAGTLLSLTSGGLTVTGQLTPAQAAAVRPGMAVELLDEETGTRLTGRVAELGAPTTAPPAGRVVPLGGAAPAPAPGQAPGGAPAGPSYVPVTVTPDAPPPAALSGRNVRITVLKDAAGPPVTAVPVAAVFTGANGRTSVTTVAADGRRADVEVTTGVTADGLVGVVPDVEGALKAGDRVVVGT